MTSPRVPEAILIKLIQKCPYVPGAAWEKLSARRFRAIHPSPEYAFLAVVAFGETVTTGIRIQDSGAEQAVFSSLLMMASQRSTHRLACEEHTPIVDTRRGVCRYCGALPAQHVVPLAAVPDDAEDSDGLREVGEFIGLACWKAPCYNEYLDSLHGAYLRWCGETGRTKPIELPRFTEIIEVVKDSLGGQFTIEHRVINGHEMPLVLGLQIDPNRAPW